MTDKKNFWKSKVFWCYAVLLLAFVGMLWLGKNRGPSVPMESATVYGTVVSYEEAEDGLRIRLRDLHDREDIVLRLTEESLIGTESLPGEVAGRKTGMRVEVYSEYPRENFDGVYPVRMMMPLDQTFSGSVVSCQALGESLLVTVRGNSGDREEVFLVDGETAFPEEALEEALRGGEEGLSVTVTAAYRDSGMKDAYYAVELAPQK